MGHHLRIQRRRFGLPYLCGLYTEHPQKSAVALDRDLTPAQEDALEEESRWLMESGLAEKWGGREFYYQPDCYETMSRRRINTLKKGIMDRRPDLVKAIREAAEACNEIHVMVGFAGLEDYPYPAVAVIECLRDAGELPGLVVLPD